VPVATLRRFLALESAGGIVLAGAAALAIILANSPLERYYALFLDTPVEVRFGAFQIAKPLLLWINDGLMALFFFTVGLELKREVVQGELSTPSQVALPALAALGGMAIPALVYASLNWGDPVRLQGWAIPAATDIAFALGVLSLLGPRVPQSLKIFLMTLAILDDLGAIVIIAVFYTADLSGMSLGIAGVMLLVLLALNRAGVQRVAPYMVAGLVLWASVLKSGVHATLAGAALAAFIPARGARRLEEDLHGVVALGILPLFAFANAGVALRGVTLGSLALPVPLGIAAGLLLGKTAGVLLATWGGVRLGLASLPAQAKWADMAGIAALCGIGFTMSLFIGGLAFEGALAEYGVQTRLGILAGSLASALAGYAILRLSLGPSPAR